MHSFIRMHKVKFDFYLNARSGVPVYVQLIQQVKGALRLGTLRAGDQLPTVKEAVARLVVSPNTVLKAYRQLELEGLIDSRPAVGTFVTGTLGPGLLQAHADLRQRLEDWMRDAFAAGLGDEQIEALIEASRQRLARGGEGVA
jgi:GntR family transcriptional regulator